MLYGARCGDAVGDSVVSSGAPSSQVKDQSVAARCGGDARSRDWARPPRPSCYTGLRLTSMGRKDGGDVARGKEAFWSGRASRNFCFLPSACLDVLGGPRVWGLGVWPGAAPGAGALWQRRASSIGHRGCTTLRSGLCSGGLRRACDRASSGAGGPRGLSARVYAERNGEFDVASGGFLGFGEKGVRMSGGFGARRGVGGGSGALSVATLTLPYVVCHP